MKHAREGRLKPGLGFPPSGSETQNSGTVEGLASEASIITFLVKMSWAMPKVREMRFTTLLPTVVLPETGGWQRLRERDRRQNQGVV